MADGDGSSSGSLLGALGEEFKKFGSAAAHQVTGADDSGGKASDQIGQIAGIGSSIVGQVSGGVVGEPSDSLDIAGQLGGFGKSVSSQVGAADAVGESSEAPKGHQGTSGDHSFMGELKKLGFDAVSQISGHDLAAKQAEDEKFSAQAQAEIKAKIAAIYAEYAQKQKQKEAVEEHQEAQVEQQKEQIAEAKKQQSIDVQVAQTKASAENKNMGAE